MTNTEKLFNAFVEGQELTAKQITARFGIANPRAAVYDLRTSGYPIYLNKRKDTKGRQTLKYRLGTPSRRVIAAGYKALAAGLV